MTIELKLVRKRTEALCRSTGSKNERYASALCSQERFFRARSDDFLIIGKGAVNIECNSFN